MGLLSILSGSLKFVNFLSRIIERRGLMNQGDARAVGRMSQEVLGNVEKAMAARRSVPKYLAGDELPDDPDRRD